MPRGFSAVAACCVLLYLADTALANALSVKLVNNGYENLVVAIAETVPDSQSATAIARIKVGDN